MRLSPHQRNALQAVADGRVEYGIEYPEMARRAAARGRRHWPAFLVDGNEPYGAAKQTLPALEERGLIRVRHEDVPTERVPARQASRHSLTGSGEMYTIPEHDEPVDPGWRAPVELTDAGRTTLEKLR